MNYATVSYGVYLIVMAGVTFGVGQRLHHHGRPFLLDVFRGQEQPATITNSLLLAGYYLVNFALVLLLLRQCEPVTDLETAVSFVTQRTGVVLTLLGAMHLGNVLVLSFVHRWLVRRAHALNS